jgi:hypothetical protein
MLMLKIANEFVVTCRTPRPVANFARPISTRWRLPLQLDQSLAVNDHELSA